MVPGCSCRAGGPLARAEGREVGVARLGGIFGSFGVDGYE